MMTLLKLFGKSPFAPLEVHMEEVTNCVYKLTDLFEALEEKDYDKLKDISEKISAHEHTADLKKNDIRNHLPKSLFLPIDRGSLLQILTIQDSIADVAQDVAILSTLKPLEFHAQFQNEFKTFLDKNIETFKGARRIIKELHELLESSFGGVEAEKVRKMIKDVGFNEHETDILQRKLLKSFFQAEDQMTYSTFYLWLKIFERIGSISNLSENLALNIRTTLELK